MVRHKFYIVKSIKLHISHALLAKPGVKLEDVKEVVSHTQALQQCSNFLKANPNIKVTIFENTATAAKYVAESGRTDLARSCMDCMFCRMACRITKTTIPDLSALQRTWKFMQAPTVSV